MIAPDARDGIAVAEAAAVRARSRTAVRAFYVAMTLVLIAMVARGFWPTYYGPLTRGTFTGRHWFIHLHGAIFTGWMALLLTQVVLVATGRVRAHRRLGTFGIAYGALVLIVGSIVSVVAPVLHVRAGEWTLDAAASFLILPLGDMLLFGGFFGAAVKYRRQPEVHKRLVLAATVALAFAAVARIFEPSLWKILVVWLAPLAAAMAFDVYLTRRVHRVNVLAGIIFLIAFTRVLAMNSHAWLSIGRTLLAPFL